MKGGMEEGKEGWRREVLNIQVISPTIVRDHSYKALALGSNPASKDDSTVYPSGRSYAVFCQKWPFNRDHQYARRTLRVD